jgi:hypothetical protein
VQKEVIPVWIPASGTQFAVRYMLRKDKTQSTAFRVAQIFLSRRQKYPALVSMPPQDAENEQWHVTRFKTRVWEEGAT